VSTSSSLFDVFLIILQEHLPTMHRGWKQVNCSPCFKLCEQVWNLQRMKHKMQI